MRQRFAKNLGGTLRCLPPEVGPGVVPASATVTLRRSSGVDLPVPVADADATIGADGVLSFVLVPANTPDPLTAGYLYRAVWTYVIGGVTYQTDQTYEVNARILKPTLRREDVEPRLPSAWEDLVDGGDLAISQEIEDAWSDLLDDLLAKGFRPDRIMDPDRLRGTHRAKVLANLYGSFGPQWAEQATKADASYLEALDKVLSSVGWYDAGDDTKGSDLETKVVSIVCTR